MYNNEIRPNDKGGDIHASYSADIIAMAGKIRRPFLFNGSSWACTSLSGRGGIEEAEAYRLVHVRLFEGKATTYDKKTEEDGAETARSDPFGFYHRMSVKSGKETFVMVGPPMNFVADAKPQRPGDSDNQPEQLSLFPIEPR